MKTNDLAKDVLIVAAFVGLAYVITRNYRKRKERQRESREFVHFQLF